MCTVLLPPGGYPIAVKYIIYHIYRVIHKSLRDFRPLRYSNRDGNAEGEHINRGRDTPSFCPTLQVIDMSTLGDAADVKFGNFEDTERFLFPVHAMFRHDCPLAIKPASTPRRLVHKKQIGEILYLFICSFVLCLSWLLRSGVRKFRRDLWITLYYSVSYATDDTLVQRMRCACHTTKAAMVMVPHRSIQYLRCMSVLVHATMATSWEQSLPFPRTAVYSIYVACLSLFMLLWPHHENSLFLFHSLRHCDRKETDVEVEKGW
jgi:hypothetical protein